MTDIKKNLSYNIFYQMLIIIIPFITTPYISRVIGKDGVGIYSYTYSIANYFVLFAMLGLNNYGNRMIAKCKDNKKMLSKEFSSIYVFQLITGFIMIVLYFIYIKVFDSRYYEYSLIQAIYVISCIFDINWLFFGLEKFKITVTRNTFIKIASTICIFLFVKNETDIGKYIFIVAFGTLLSQLALWIFVKKEVKFVRPTMREIAQHIKPNIILFIPVIAVSLYKVMDKIMLGNMSQISQVGLYESAEKIVSVPLTLVAAFGTVMLPRTTNLLSNNNENKAKEYLEKALMFIVFASIPIVGGLGAISEEFTGVYLGTSFQDAAILIRLLSITIPFVGIANVIRTQYLIPREKDKEYIISVVSGAGVNLIMNLILIPKLNAVGAVIGTICAEATVCILQIIFFKEKNILVKNIRYILYAIISTVIMCIVVNGIGRLIENNLLKIIVKVITGVLIYVAMNCKIIIEWIGGNKNESNII